MSMDSDDLSEMAWEWLSRGPSGFRIPWNGILALGARIWNEHVWLCGVFKSLKKIAENPDSYVNYNFMVTNWAGTSF